VQKGTDQVVKYCRDWILKCNLKKYGRRRTEGYGEMVCKHPNKRGRR
jgi:hypothetical protein